MHASIRLSLLLIATLSSCARAPVEPSRLDSSGVTVVTLEHSLVLAHSLPTIAAGVRDYAYIGPVEINNMGNREYYLWVSLASTIDREFLGLSPTDTSEIVFLVDDEPMQFSVVQWRTELDAPPYISSTPVYATLEAKTTLDQIHRIAAAETVELHLIADNASGSRYQFWNGDWAEWQEFPEGR
ncbi:MAG: hypothetical protein ACR2QR_01105 [Woeseiaceae bacterium]